MISSHAPWTPIPPVLDDWADREGQQAHGAVGQPASAGLVARKARLVGEQDSSAAAGEVHRRGRPGRAGAHDQDVEALHALIVGDRRRATIPPRPQGFPSGQRGRAVNPLAQPSEVRILLPAPPVKFTLTFGKHVGRGRLSPEQLSVVERLERDEITAEQAVKLLTR